MKNYTNKILSELVGSSNFFQFENSSFQTLYPNNPYHEIKQTINSFSSSFLTSFYDDIKYLEIYDYNIDSITADSHNGCKKVVIIKENSGRQLVYKSKPINSEPLIAQLLLSINRELNSDIFYIPPIYTAYNGYFNEYIYAENNNDINDFLYSFGNLLVYVKLLGLSDLHVENILIKNNRVCILDYESIFNYSSLRLEILQDFHSCTSIFDEFTILDSLLLNPKGQGFEIDSKIQQAYSLNSFSLSSPKYYSIVLKGIKNAVKLVQVKKSELIDLINTYINNGMASRLILRPTAFYEMLVRNHFKTLHQLESVKQLKEKLHHILFMSNDKVYDKILKCEVDSLSFGDIPYFIFSNNTLIINNEVIHNYQTISIRDIIINEVDKIDICYVEYKNYFDLKKAYVNKEHIINPIQHKQIVSCDKAGVKETRLSYMGCDLYSGYAGFTLGFCNNEKIFCELYSNYIKQFSSIINQKKLHYIPIGGAFEGLTSLLYYFIIVYQIYKDEDVKNLINKVLIPVINKKIKESSGNNSNEDLMCGLFGQIAVFDMYQNIFKNSEFDLFINDVLNSPIKNNNLGVAHGLAGRLLMELKLSKKYYNLQRIQELQKIFLNNFSNEHNNWLDYRTNDYDSHYWCNGGLGINIVLTESLKQSYSEELKEILDRYNQHYVKENPDTHLCCGEGIQLLQNNKYNFSSEKYLYEDRIGFYNLAFFTGRSGVNYYKRKPKKFPNILMLEY